MKKFLLGFIAVAAVLLPLSQKAEAHWGYYHHYYGYHSWHRGPGITAIGMAAIGIQLTGVRWWLSPRIDLPL
jgi:hypothetical protein